MATLPDYVRECGMCDGKGEYEQTYTAGCGGGYFSMMGTCGYCSGTGLRYHDGGPVPPSVLNQINVARGRI